MSAIKVAAAIAAAVILFAMLMMVWSYAAFLISSPSTPAVLLGIAILAAVLGSLLAGAFAGALRLLRRRRGKMLSLRSTSPN